MPKRADVAFFTFRSVFSSLFVPELSRTPTLVPSTAVGVPPALKLSRC